MSNEVKHPGDCVNKPLANDYINNGHPNPSDPQFRWNGPSFKDRPAPATNEELAAMRAAAPKKRATFFERMEAAKKTGEVVRPSVVILGKDSYEKVQ